MDLLDRMLLHDAWTTRQLLALAADLSDDQLDQRFDLGPGSVRATLIHIVNNITWWTDLMSGRPQVSSGLREHASIEQITEQFDLSTTRFHALARSIHDDQRLNDTFVDHLGDPPKKKHFGAGILHLTTHGMHHRGQLLFMLRRLGVQHVPEGDAMGWEKQHVGGWDQA